MMPEQHAVLAAAAVSSGKQSVSARGPKKTIGKKRLFVNISTGSSSSSSSASRRRNFKGDCAVLKFMRAKYMKGEKESQLSGAVYMQGKVRYAKGKNERFKEKAEPKLLGEVLRFNDEIRLYRAKVYSVEQAIMIREVMQSISKEDAADLASSPTDDEIREVFNFPEVNVPVINIISSMVFDGKEKLAIKGTTYAWRKQQLKDAGFEFAGDGFWAAPLGTATEELEQLFEEYGFQVEHFDGVDGEHAHVEDVDA